MKGKPGNTRDLLPAHLQINREAKRGTVTQPSCPQFTCSNCYLQGLFCWAVTKLPILHFHLRPRIYSAGLSQPYEQPHLLISLLETSEHTSSCHPQQSSQPHICTRLFSSEVLHCSPSHFSLDRHSGSPRTQKMLIFPFHFTLANKLAERKKKERKEKKRKDLLPPDSPAGKANHLCSTHSPLPWKTKCAQEYIQGMYVILY